MAQNIKWDIEEITELIGQLDKDRQKLVDCREFLININKEIETAWQGYAGRSFDERMDIDAENVDITIKGIEELTKDLKNVVSQCYESCENSIDSEIKKLKGKI